MEQYDGALWIEERGHSIHIQQAAVTALHHLLQSAGLSVVSLSLSLSLSHSLSSLYPLASLCLSLTITATAAIPPVATERNNAVTGEKHTF